MPWQPEPVSVPKSQPIELHTVPDPPHLKHLCTLVGSSPDPSHALHRTFPKSQPMELHTVPEPPQWKHVWPTLQSEPLHPAGHSLQVTPVWPEEHVHLLGLLHLP